MGLTFSLNLGSNGGKDTNNKPALKRSSSYLNEDKTEMISFQCAICLEYAQEPLQTPCCSHPFCKCCITTSLYFNPHCPMCRRSLHTSMLKTFPISKMKAYKKLRIVCKNDGCGIALTMDKVKEHAKTCSKQSVLCPHDQCGLIVILDNLLDHTLKCDWRPVTCHLCSDSFPLKSIDAHLTHCAILCSCGQEVQSSQHLIHLHQECPLYIISCPIECCASQFPRSQLATHLITTATEHIEILTKAKKTSTKIAQDAKEITRKITKELISTLALIPTNTQAFTKEQCDLIGSFYFASDSPYSIRQKLGMLVCVSNISGLILKGAYDWQTIILGSGCKIQLVVYMGSKLSNPYIGMFVNVVENGLEKFNDDIEPMPIRLRISLLDHSKFHLHHTKVLDLPIPQQQQQQPQQQKEFLLMSKKDNPIEGRETPKGLIDYSTGQTEWIVNDTVMYGWSQFLAYASMESDVMEYILKDRLWLWIHPVR